jgi:UDP-N-acetylglucosamine--dolichyl-phosphate N-acetylglucosaminephosphotransferase
LLITDTQKLPARRVPYLAGLGVAFGAVVGILFFIAAQTFFYTKGPADYTGVLLASVSTILIALLIGIVDDLLGERIGLRQYQKPLLTLFAALPLAVVNAGENVVSIPFFGFVALGHLYPFLILPVGVVGATNGFNILAGLNGLEAGMGVLILGTLGYLAWVTESFAAAVIAVCVLAALLVFFWFNRFPARILPGNSLTYAVGASIAVVAIIGDLERSALILFVPYFLEFFLKLRGMFQKESLARPLADGSLANKYRQWYSLNHVVVSLLRKIKGSAREWEVACTLLLFELVFVFAACFLAKL